MLTSLKIIFGFYFSVIEMGLRKGSDLLSKVEQRNMNYYEVDPHGLGLFNGWFILNLNTSVINHM